MLKLENYDKLLIVYLILFSLVLLLLLDVPSIMSDDGTHMLLSLFYRDLITTIFKNQDFSFSKVYNFSISYLIHYPKLQVFYPPLYHLVTGLIFYSLFGVSSFAARFSNFLFGVLSIIVLYILSSSILKNKKLAFFSVLAFSLSPITLIFIRISLKDFTAIFFTLLSMFLFFATEKFRKKRYFFLCGLSSFLAVMGDRPGFVAFAVLLTLFFLKKEKLKNILVFFLTFFILLLPYALLILKLNGLEINLLIYKSYGFLKQPDLGHSLFFLPILGVLIYSLFYYVKRRGKFWKELLIWFGVSFIIIFFMCFQPRFYPFFLIPSYVTFGYLIGKRRKIILLLFLVFCVVTALYTIKKYHFPTYPVREVVDFIYTNLPDRTNVALLTEKDNTLYTSSFTFPLAILDKNKTITFLRPCYLWDKTKGEKINILKEHGVYFVISIKDTPDYGNVTQIKDELEKVYERDIIEVYKFKDFTPTDRICNYICTTEEVLCTSYDSPFDVYS